MNNQLRRQQIIKMVDSVKHISVVELAYQLNASVETIRRDLNYLEKMGRLVRVHGGARTFQREDLGEIFKKRRNERVEAKQIMAQKALGLIERYMTISLDASSSDWFLAKMIPDIPLTVLTNSLEIVKELGGLTNVQVICVGGDYNARYSDFVGDIAQRNFRSFHINISFVSCFGVNIYSGLWENSKKNAETKKTMIEVSNKTVLLADSSKFGRKSPYNMADWSMVKYVVSDNQLDSGIIKHLNSFGVTVI